MREGKAFCHGAATIVNGIATGKGASFGIGLRTEARVRLVDEPGTIRVRIQNDPGEDTTLAVCCVKNVLRKFGCEDRFGAEVETRSDIPISRGLKSSSAAANAIVLAAFSALGESCSDLEIINTGIEASFESGVTITGAFDDSCACYFGGVVVTDNVERTILKRYLIEEELSVLIHVPPEKIRKADVHQERLTGIAPAIGTAHDLALSGDFKTGLMINSLAYGAAMGLDTGPALRALHNGAVTAGISGTGPATVVLCRPEHIEKVSSSIGNGSIIRTTLNNVKARIF